MVIIYDFDGTLTVSGMPQYEILNKCGYDLTRMKRETEIMMKREQISVFDAYYRIYKKVLFENGVPFNDANVILGADKIEYNPGVMEFLSDLQYKKTKIRHFIVTSGLKEFVINSKIAPFFDGIYGTTYSLNNGVFEKIDYKLGPLEKVGIIKNISSKYGNNIVYIGDGLTDGPAFAYVHSIGGISILVGDDKKCLNMFKGTKKISKFFVKNFSTDSELRKYIDSLIDG